MFLLIRRYWERPGPHLGCFRPMANLVPVAECLIEDANEESFLGALLHLEAMGLRPELSAFAGQQPGEAYASTVHCPHWTCIKVWLLQEKPSRAGTEYYATCPQKPLAYGLEAALHLPVSELEQSVYWERFYGQYARPYPGRSL